MVPGEFWPIIKLIYIPHIHRTLCGKYTTYSPHAQGLDSLAYFLQHFPKAQTSYRLAYSPRHATSTKTKLSAALCLATTTPNAKLTSKKAVNTQASLSLTPTKSQTAARASAYGKRLTYGDKSHPGKNVPLNMPVTMVV